MPDLPLQDPRAGDRRPPEQVGRADAAFYDDLDGVWREAWAILSEGVTDRHASAHTPVLATTAPDGAPDPRVVVLRGVEPDRRWLRCHTDVRSNKVDHLRTNPRVAVLVYDKDRKIQLRLGGTARVHVDDAVADAAWAATRLMSRRCYMAPIGPGAASDHPTSGLPRSLERRDPIREESEEGRANFAVVGVTIDRLEWLYLAARGHRRALFTRVDGRDEAVWLVP